MCTTCDCSEGVARLQLGNTGCRRCGSQPYVVLNKVHVECKECFLESCNKKIRSTIGRSKLLRNNDPILVAYSGGPSSSALLDLLKNSMENEFRREQKFKPSILHVDMHSILERDPDKLKRVRHERTISLMQHLQDTYPNWTLYYTTIESAFVGDTMGEHPFHSYNKNELEDQLVTNKCALDSMHDRLKDSDLTDRQKLIQDKTFDLIQSVASAINEHKTGPDDKFKFVFTGSSATQLANDLLVNVILGEGSTVNSTVSICDRRSLVPVLRPMRDFSKKEVTFYVRARNVRHYIIEDPSTYADRKASIQNVTEHFLSKLYVDYPATYSTLLRTGNKMQD